MTEPSAALDVLIQRLRAEIEEADNSIDQGCGCTTCMLLGEAADTLAAQAAQVAVYEGHDLVCNSDRHTPPGCSCLGRARRALAEVTAERDFERQQIQTVGRATMLFVNAIKAAGWDGETGSAYEAMCRMLADRDAQVREAQEHAFKVGWHRRSYYKVSPKNMDRDADCAAFLTTHAHAARGD